MGKSLGLALSSKSSCNVKVLALQEILAQSLLEL